MIENKSTRDLNAADMVSIDRYGCSDVVLPMDALMERGSR